MLTRLKALIKVMRPKQWVKNILILIAVIFDRQVSLTNPQPLIRSLIGVLILTLLASAVYIVNDLIDVQADRLHPQKRFRPIASGALPIYVAIMVFFLLLSAALLAAYLLSLGFFIICLAYFLLTLSYSKWLKHIPLVDVIVLATFYLMRVGAGITIIHVGSFSPWLYVVTGLGALFVGLGKRRAELVLMSSSPKGYGATRKVLAGYTLPLLDQLIAMISSCIILAYSLYTFSAPYLFHDHRMMLTIPIIIYGVFRYLYLIQVKEECGSPEDLVFIDRPLQFTILCYGIAILAIFYILPQYH